MVLIHMNRGEQRLIDAAWRRIAQKPENLDRRDDFQPCFVCGRPVDTKKATMRWLHVINGGSHAAEPDDKIDEGGDLGMHPVGADCLRRQPARVRAVATPITSHTPQRSPPL